MVEAAPPLAARSGNQVLFDNLLRRELKVSDPRDPLQVATALLARFPADAEAMRREREGLPVSRELLPPIQAPVQSGTRSEIAQARSDLDADLDAITCESQLKDVQAELRGWARAIRAAAGERLAAARFALDAGQRDRAMAARRTLNDFARLSRFVGALSSGLNGLYRRVAQSCDEVANLILVCAGDAIAESGLTRGALLLQAPVSELRSRRDAALGALRNLIGSTQTAYGPNDWPRGLEAYRVLLEQLDTSGQSDLRALLNEANLGSVLDGLIDMANNQTPDGLRALGATAQVSIGWLRRLVRVGQSVQRMMNQGRRLTPDSPPLAILFSALSLFTDAFVNSRAGSRLIFVARPPLLSYGFYGASGSGSDTGANTLNILMVARSRIAEQVDCFMRCDCSVDVVSRQIQLDLLVYQIDRVIDLYALGDPDSDDAVRGRAMALGALATAYLNPQGRWNGAALVPSPMQAPAPTPAGQPTALALTLAAIAGELDWARWVAWGGAFRRAAARGDFYLDDDGLIRGTAPAVGNLPPGGVPFTGIAEMLHAELCSMLDAETGWEAMVSALAPSCYRDDIMQAVLPTGPRGSVSRQLIEQGKVEVEFYVLTRRTCAPFAISIPPNFESVLEEIANDP